MSLADVIQAALDRMQYMAKTETVIGEPITAGGVTLIPVSKISIGFAAGGGGNENKAGSGAGTGGGITVTPVAFISVSEGKVQVHPVEKNDPNLGKILSMAPEIIQKVQNFMKRNGAGDCKDGRGSKKGGEEHDTE
jgi:uncharacterized spore protein YtfJ